MTSQESDGRRLRGERSRQAVLERAMNIASIEGLDGLSIGRLATEVDSSKSGVAALFGSKEKLQLATVEAAAEVFVAEVVAPAREHPRGLARVWAYSIAWLRYSERRVFAGACFFRAVAADFDSKPGAVRELIVGSIRTSDSYFQHALQTAIDNGELGAETDAAQLRFEISGLYFAANDESVLFDDATVYDRALRGIRSRLIAAGADASALPVPDSPAEP
ncbi:TetR/AcrR family transcriptional regulator [Glaciibacter superstes]|uniref:TetR/AcrR family transcriptional regulator n=1 Tax=Glaciibacter superstes TaxID=501023 RepID=UPI0003B3C8AC|nr:TetR/AcrR family transcriptional regulator [Glaciibacter superstes]